MKASTIFSVFVLLLFLFSACNSISPTPTAPAPTVAPSVTEAPTIVPTENPLAGAPEGATGKNSNGEWTKQDSIEAGVTDVYKNVTDPKSSEVLAQGWYKDIIVNPTYQGGIPLTFAPTAAAVHIWCEEGLQCPTIQHIDSPNYVDNVDNLFNRSLMSAIFHRIYGKNATDGSAFNTDLGNGKVSISFTTAHGDPYTYQIRPESRMNIYIKKAELSNPNFSQKSYIQASISGDDQGNVNVVEYSYKPIESMSHLEFVQYFLTYLFSVFFTDDISQSSFAKWVNNPALGVVIYLSVKGPNPYFIITP